MTATGVLPVILSAMGAALWLWLALRLFYASRRREASRAGYFNEIAALFDAHEIVLLPTGFPRLKGWRNGKPLILTVLPDPLSFRKLPALWVVASLPTPLPVRASLDFMARPTGTETFSRFSELPHALPTPAWLPPWVAIRSDDATKVPPESFLRDHVDLFANPAVKELVISPNGLRLVFLAEEADRNRYLLFRDSELGNAPLSPRILMPLLDKLSAIASALKPCAMSK